jgi:hypothetical protein
MAKCQGWDCHSCRAKGTKKTKKSREKKEKKEKYPEEQLWREVATYRLEQCGWDSTWGSTWSFCAM